MVGNSGKTHPSEVAGKYRSIRVKLSACLVVFFLALPWIKVRGHPALLLDVAERKFSIFGLLFWAQDVPLLLFVAGIFVFAIMLVTAVFGRAWCGWACPQTVFVDRVFREIEKAIEGDAVSRRRLDAGPFTSEKFFKKAAKWTLFLVVGAVISHSFLAYFVGTEALAKMVSASPAENLAPFFVMLGFLSFTLFNFGWFRERFCTHVCPYGRLQTVLLDEFSWVVAYDVKRGEPRRVASGRGPAGDCISCNKCVAVCPTGIDIRNGLQLECIACTGCMDACDSVMGKIGKPKGLIRYSSMHADRVGRGGEKLSLKRSIFRARPVLYFSVLLTLLFGFGWVLSKRQPLDLEFIRATGSPFEEVHQAGAPREITNRFNVDLHNLTFEARRITLAADGLFPGGEIVSPNLPLTLAAGEQRRIVVFFRFPQSLLVAGGKNLKLTVRSRGTDELEVAQSVEVRFVGPY